MIDSVAFTFPLLRDLEQVTAVAKSEIRRSCAPSPSPAPENGDTAYIRDEGHWAADDELVVIKCWQTVSCIWRSQLVRSPLFAVLFAETTSVAIYEGRRLVDITAHYKDTEGFALLLDALDPG